MRHTFFCGYVLYFFGYTCTLIHFYLLLHINKPQHNFIHFSIMGLGS